MCFVLDDSARLTLFSLKGCKSSLSDGLHPFFVFPAQWAGSGAMCCPLRSILACVRNLCYRVGKGKWLKVSCLSCERKRSPEWLKKTWEISQKTWEIFQKTLEIILKMSNVFPETWESFLDASEMITAAPANSFQRAELFIVKKAFNDIPRACVRAHTTAILHFLLSQPSQISV